MARTVVLPMIPPANAQKIGTTDDPWRPKYLREAGLGFTNSANFRYWMVCDLIGDDAIIDTVVAQPDVYEVSEIAALSGVKRTRMQQWLAKRGIVDANLDLTGVALADELRRICLAAQAIETPENRATIFADMTGL